MTSAMKLENRTAVITGAAADSVVVLPFRSLAVVATSRSLI